MGLFNKKKLSLDEILKAIAELSEEEKAQVKAQMEEKPEVEETTEGVEEVSVNEEQGEAETKPEGELKEYNDFEETEGEELEENQEQVAPTEQTEQPTEQVNDERTTENQAEVIQGLTSRIEALEEQLAQFNELKELMENFTKKQADSFGYKGAIPGAKKDINEMSAKELKEKMLNGEI